MKKNCSFNKMQATWAWAMTAFIGGSAGLEMTHLAQKGTQGVGNSQTIISFMDITMIRLSGIIYMSLMSTGIL